MTSDRAIQPRQADIARAAGVSQSTVSLVLAGSGDLSRVSPATYARVIKAATDLGYDGPVMVTRPRSRRLQLGVHTFERVFPTRSSDYYTQFLTAIEEQAAIEGCNLILFTALHQPGGDHRLYAEGRNELRHASGSLLLGRSTDDDDVAKLIDDNYPFVYVGERTIEGRSVNFVGADYRTTTGQLTAELLGLGHTRIGYLGEPSRTPLQEQRWNGFLDVLTRFGLSAPTPSFLSPDELSAEWLDAQLRSGVTALLIEAATQLKVIETLAAIGGIGIPEQLSVVLLVDVPADSPTTRDWAQLNVPRADMGSRAVQLLIEIIRNPTGSYERQVLLPCHYTLGATTGAPAPPDSTRT
ncbi:LacI family DNA-binding transcriptional regulator [Leifsonia sp. H3M29-4]|uniref:LacI family DNA-binding transcriptional regulator n=1 Tax=Salinibacterium metalliresistens TaxID=3031321 RepID=UPI0023D9A3F0|nr:LacI family DNA-binding transcriptional regulator [Salinibacterium metalliresistens]MDF1477982.1 LacI family DNA-binding transcriptional regulator [Salinibacterium metalliresistens]